MIAKGNLHGDGAKLARYMMTGEKGEIAELVETRGLEFFGSDPVEAFAMLQQVAEAMTGSTKPFFHSQTRNAPGEQLTREQWLQVADRQEKRLGFTGQPRIVSFHRNPATGEQHLHVAWCRIDLETMRAIDPGMFKNHLKELSRKLEQEFGLKPVSNDRGPDDKTPAPDRKEFEEARRLKIDLKATRNAILDCWQRSDSGKALNAALGAHGLMLAYGDRRDCFVVVDPAGGQHALNKKLTGLTLAATRDRLGDLDRTQLPGVEQAKAQQHVREAAREARQAERAGIELAAERTMQEARAAARGRTDDVRPVFTAAADRTTEPQAPNFDRDAANREWEDKIAAASIAAERAMQEARHAAKGRTDDTRPDAARAAPEARERPEPEDMRPLGKTAGEIRTAWTLSGTAEELEEALAARGITLAVVTAEEARQSERIAAFAKEAGNFASKLREGEIVAVDQHGSVHRLDQRTTGDLRPEIEARLNGFAGIDRAGLLNVTAAKEAMQEAARAAWKDEQRTAQDMARPLTGIEATIAETLASTMTGTEFAAALDQAGLTITRATEADQLALDALRRDEDLARLAAEVNREAREPHFFAKLEPGDYAAVTRGGDVFRLNPTALDFEEAEQRLGDVQPRLASVTEARAVNEIRREQSAELWAQRRDENAQAYALRSENRDAEQAIRSTDAQLNGAVYDVADAVEETVDRGFKAARRLLDGAVKMVEGWFAFLVPGPTLTPDQAERHAAAAHEQAEVNAAAAATQEKAADQDERIFNQDRQQQQDDFAARYGVPGGSSARSRERDDDYDRGRERER